MRSLTHRTRTLAALVGGLGLVALMTSVPVSGGPYEWGDSRATITFSGPVALPGVELPAGQYVFKGIRGDLVQVVSRDGGRVLFMGFTHRVPRPRRIENNEVMVAFGEPARDAPQPIAVWYPRSGEGHEFIYR